jgi:hypothetical protein
MIENKFQYPNFHINFLKVQYILELVPRHYRADITARDTTAPTVPRSDITASDFTASNLTAGDTTALSI